MARPPGQRGSRPAVDCRSGTGSRHRGPSRPPESRPERACALDQSRRLLWWKTFSLDGVSPAGALNRSVSTHDGLLLGERDRALQLRLPGWRDPLVAHMEERLSRGRGRSPLCAWSCGVWCVVAAREAVRAFAGFATFGHAHIRGLAQDLCSSHLRCLKSSAPARGAGAQATNRGVVCASREVLGPPRQPQRVVR